MRLALVMNDTNWQTIADKVAQTKAFFAPIDDLEITVFQSNITSFEWSTVETIGGITNTIGPKETLDISWLEANIKKSGFDTTAFYLDEVHCVGHNYPTGIDYSIKSPGMIVLYGAAGLRENDTASVNGIQLGNSFVLFLCHELSHQYYLIQGKQDNTHLYYYSGVPVGVLTDLKNPPATQPSVEQWAKAIERWEGANLTLNNPGNLGFAPLEASWGATQGPAKSDGGYLAQFGTYTAGFTALCNFLTLAVHDELRAYHGARTLDTFTEIYAGHPPLSYKQGIATMLGVPLTTNISTFIS